MKARMKIVAQHWDRTTEELYATPITLTVPGYSKPIMAAVDKRGNRWFVTDIETGAYIIRGRTRKEAIALAVARLETAGEAAYDAAVRHWGLPTGPKDEAGWS
jgi:hypothetical protein